MHSNVNPRWVGLTGNRCIIDSMSLARSVAAEENVGTTDGMRRQKDGLGRSRNPSRRTRLNAYYYLRCGSSDKAVGKAIGHHIM